MNDNNPDSAGDPIGQRQAWLAAVENVLHGRSFEQVLVSRTRDGLDIEPLYDSSTAPVVDTSLPGAGTFVRGSIDVARLRHGWDIRQPHGGDDLDAVNVEIVDDLERGVTSIELDRPAAGWTVERMGRALDGVMLDVAPVALAPHADLDAARAVIGLWDRDDVRTDTRGSLGLDPLGEHGRSGHAGSGQAGSGEPGSVDATECASFVVEQLATRPLVHGLVVDSQRYVDAGATEVQELAWGTATGVAYLRALVDAGLDVDHAAPRIAFRWAATGEQFLTIAKLRAARRMWARALEVSGLAAADRVQYQQAVTPLAMFSRRDPWVNLIRATTAALAAVVGGADSVTVLRFDRLVDRSDRLGRRAARNTQILLMEESHLGRIVDPAGGSWFVESLTDRLANEAWVRFREVEQAGGMASYLASGVLRQDVDASWAVRLNALGTREEAWIGVNRFPDLDEATPIPAEGGADSGRGLPIRRPAAPFERLRDAADRHRAETGNRPHVHIAAIGAQALHASRSTWVTNMLGVGGVAVTGGDVDGSESPIAVEAAFAASGATVAAICAVDALYAERGPSTAMALREAGAELIALVGDPGERRDELMAAGIDEFWHEGVDVLQALQRLHHVLGIAPTHQPATNEEVQDE